MLRPLEAQAAIKNLYSPLVTTVGNGEPFHVTCDNFSLGFAPLTNQTLDLVTFFLKKIFYGTVSISFAIAPGEWLDIRIVRNTDLTTLATVDIMRLNEGITVIPLPPIPPNLSRQTTVSPLLCSNIVANSIIGVPDGTAIFEFSGYLFPVS